MNIVWWKNYMLVYITRSIIIFYCYCQLLRFFALYSAESIANKSYTDHLFINIRTMHDWFVNNDLFARSQVAFVRKNIRLIFFFFGSIYYSMWKTATRLNARPPFIPPVRVKTPRRANPENTVIHEYLGDSHSARLSRVPLFMDVTQRQPSYS